MGAFDKLFKRPKTAKQVNGYFKMLDGYTPIFTDYDGGVYEMELTRACIHTFANHCSKLKPTVTGPDKLGIQAILDGRPNLFMTSAQFVYKVATIYDTKNTCFIVPVLDSFDRLVGYYPVNPQQTEIVEVGGEPWLRYTFRTGEKAAIELARCGVVSKYLYNSDIRGETNMALLPTLQLLHTQNQGIEEGIRNSASFRFMATVNNFTKGKDLANERKNWVDENLGPDSGGLALFPNSYSNVQQITSTAKIVEPEQMKLIQERVLNYFGCSEDVLQNKTVGDAWSAYYEGKIEPFALQLSQAMTCMSFTQKERSGAHARAIVWSANRLQYMTNADKLQVSSQMFDRGILTTNDVMDIWNLPHVEEGDKRYIRKEYTEVSQLDQMGQPELPAETAPASVTPTDQPVDAETEQQIVDDATDVVKQPLLVGQIQALTQIVADYQQGKYTYNQAVNMLVIGVGLTEEEAERLLDKQDQETAKKEEDADDTDGQDQTEK